MVETHPVGRSTKRNASTPVPARVDLTRNSPSHRAPRTRKSRNEETRKDNHHISNRLAIAAFAVIEGEVSERREDQKANEHPGCSQSETLPSTELLDHVEAGECGDNVDGAEDDLGNEGVAEADGREYGCPEIEEEICS